MSGFGSFMTGLLEGTTETINKRKDKAEDYFDQQMERAATTGREALTKRRGQHQQISTLANNLMQQAEMPEDIVRGLANDGPEALEQAYKIYSQSVENGVEVNEDFWRDAYEFSAEISTEGQSLGDFLKQVSGLYPANLQAVQEEGGDPFSAFVSSGLGLNAMDRSRSRLETTEVADGFSARDLINMSSNPQSTRPLGDVNYTMNLQAIQAAEDAAEARREGSGVPKNLSISERGKLGVAFLDSVEKDGAEAFKSASGGLQEGAEAPDRDTFMKEYAEKSAVKWLNSYGVSNLAWIKANIPVLYDALPANIREAHENGTITDVPVDGVVPDTNPDEITTTPLDEELRVGIPLPSFLDEGVEWKYVGTTSSGQVVYENAEGVRTDPINVEDIPKESFIQPEELQGVGPNDFPSEEPEPVQEGPAPTFPGMDMRTIPQERPKIQAPPKEVVIGDRKLIFTGEVTPDGKSWIYKNSTDGKPVAIPIQQ